jgi:5'(3')-deoxyribonucleotidase
MDNVIVDFASGISRLDSKTVKEYEGRLDEVPGIFALMDPMPGAIDSINILARSFDTYILSTAPWLNSTAWSDKLDWVHRYLGVAKVDPLYKRLILSHHKNLNHGDFLIDDRTANGVDQFQGEHIHFGTGNFRDWKSVTNYLLAKSQ